jgi:2-polyprenyl-6-methoxyphenol hydroxylase-like FAD-dependent oxidoreductase
VPVLANRFDLLVVSTGKGALGRMFAYQPEHSPYTQPQRLLCVGLYDGVRTDGPRGVTMSVSPGHGEMIVIPTLSFGGMKTALLMENVPGGDMADLVSLSYDENPAAFRQRILDALEKHHPSTHDRIDTHRFDLAQPLDLLQGAVVPTVRKTSVAFDNGRYAIALGDVHSVVDPMMGQGANIASYSAFEVGKAIVATDAFDDRFCEQVDQARENRVLAASRWTNLMLQPPSEALGRLIFTMAENRALCDEFTENFNYPERQWDHLASDRRIHAWIDRSMAMAA